MELNNLEHNFKCHFCLECDGYGCIGELPGMGGFNENINFQKNCEGWKEIAKILIEQGVDFSDEVKNPLPIRRLGPMTGELKMLDTQAKNNSTLI